MDKAIIRKKIKDNSDIIDNYMQNRTNNRILMRIRKKNGGSCHPPSVNFYFLFWD